MLLAGGGIAVAQPQPVAPAGIYNCVDSRGRNITSDRPIADCLDREQRELNPSGTTRRKIEPNYTAKEQAERDERARQAALLALRQTEERRRERALVTRYPNVTAHERERTEAISQIDAVIQAARKRQTELFEERRRIDGELEFYKSDPAKAPASIRRQVDDNTQSVAVQNRFIGEQEDEKRRVNARFDEERLRLRLLWPVDAGGVAR
ncbi:MAG: DUF4124 domain-containing protein [Comamonadaceae bacterium]|nr:MAG: DUF4124 domain-containing protein [Comamonadaceae bacterium]